MPYKKVYVPAGKVLTHQGVSIYYVYKDNKLSEGVRSFWFDTLEDSNDEQAFDVREIATKLSIAISQVEEKEEKIKEVLIRGIEAGLIQTRKA